MRVCPEPQPLEDHRTRNRCIPDRFTSTASAGFRYGFLCSILRHGRRSCSAITPSTSAILRVTQGAELEREGQAVTPAETEILARRSRADQYSRLGTNPPIIQNLGHLFDSHERYGPGGGIGESKGEVSQKNDPIMLYSPAGTPPSSGLGVAVPRKRSTRTRHASSLEGGARSYK